MNENNLEAGKIEESAEIRPAVNNESAGGGNISAEKKVQAAKFAEDFDIVDFIEKHSATYSVKRPRIWTKVVGIALVVVLIVALCIMAAVLLSKQNSNPIFGKWVSSDGVKMEIIEDYIIINDKSMKYIFEDDNVIALNVNNEYFKMIYELKDGKLTITIPSDEITSIEYKRENE